MELIRTSEAEKLKTKEAELIAAQRKLEEARNSGKLEAARRQIMYRAIRLQRLNRMRELQEGLQAELTHLQNQRELTRLEAEEFRTERLSLQHIKTRLRDRGLAEFQSYTPSDIEASYSPAGTVSADVSEDESSEI